MNPQLPQAMQENEGQLPLSPLAALDEELLTMPDSGEQAVMRERETTEWLGVRVGTIGLLLPSIAARELLDLPAVARLPHTPPWLVGLTNVRGTLVPVVDVAQALEVEPEEAVRHYLLIFNHGVDALGLVVDGLPHRQNFEVRERLSGLPPHPSLLDGYISGAYDHAGLLWFEIDVEGFFGELGARIEQA